MVFIGESIYTESCSQFNGVPDGKKRCKILDDIHDARQKHKKDKLAKIMTACQKCGDSSCKKHYVKVCQMCYNN